MTAWLADKDFGTVQLDVSPRQHELEHTDRIELPNLLHFAGVPAPVVEIVDVNRHAAEKFHAMTRQHGDRENTRVRDLVDLVLLIEHRLLDPVAVATRTRQVFLERDAAEPPTSLTPLPASWSERYARLAEGYPLEARSFDDGHALTQRFWGEMFSAGRGRDGR